MRDSVTMEHIEKARRHFLSHKVLILPISDADIIEMLGKRKKQLNSFDESLILRAQVIMQA